MGDILEISAGIEELKSNNVLMRNLSKNFEIGLKHNLSGKDIEIIASGGKLNFIAKKLKGWKFIFYCTGKFVLLSSHGDTETQRENTLCDFVTLCEHFLNVPNSNSDYCFVRCFYFCLNKADRKFKVANMAAHAVRSNNCAYYRTNFAEWCAHFNKFWCYFIFIRCFCYR